MHFFFHWFSFDLYFLQLGRYPITALFPNLHFDGKRALVLWERHRCTTQHDDEDAMFDFDLSIPPGLPPEVFGQFLVTLSNWRQSDNLSLKFSNGFGSSPPSVQLQAAIEFKIWFDSAWVWILDIFTDMWNTEDLNSSWIESNFELNMWNGLKWEWVSSDPVS